MLCVVPDNLRQFASGCVKHPAAVVTFAHDHLLSWGGLRRPVELPVVEDVNQLDHTHRVTHHDDPDQRRIT